MVGKFSKKVKNRTMDFLSQILEEANWKNELIVRDRLYDPWGYRFPCHKSAGFHVITQGSCYARYMGNEVRLERGDILFITKGVHHELLSSPRALVKEVNQLKVDSLSKSIAETPSTSFVSVRYGIPDKPQHPFFLSLPETIHISASAIQSHHAINTTITMISKELEHEVCSDLILQRLTDIMLYYMIRFWLERNPVYAPGWISALKDPDILRALELLHKHPERPWTIESLAKNIGISRAGIALKFKSMLSIPPMEYLAKVRMDRAKDMFQKDKRTLEEVALAVGYSSAFAFSKAYKRLFGNPPVKLWKQESESR